MSNCYTPHTVSTMHYAGTRGGSIAQESQVKIQACNIAHWSYTAHYHVNAIYMDRRATTAAGPADPSQFRRGLSPETLEIIDDVQKEARHGLRN